MSSKCDIATFTAGEVAIVQSDVLSDLVGALTVLSEGPVHFILNCHVCVSREFLHVHTVQDIIVHNYIEYEK